MKSKSKIQHIIKQMRTLDFEFNFDFNYDFPMDVYIPIAREAIIDKYSNFFVEKQVETVQQYGYAIQYIKNPSEQVQLEAVKQNGYAIECIKHPSKQVRLESAKCIFIRYGKISFQNFQVLFIELFSSFSEFSGIKP